MSMNDVDDNLDTCKRLMNAFGAWAIVSLSDGKFDGSGYGWNLSSGDYFGQGYIGYMLVARYN